MTKKSIRHIKFQARLRPVISATIEPKTVDEIAAHTNKDPGEVRYLLQELRQRKMVRILHESIGGVPYPEQYAFVPPPAKHALQKQRAKRRSSLKGLTLNEAKWPKRLPANEARWPTDF